MAKKKTLFSAQMSSEERRMFEEVAEHRGQTKMGLLRMWIRRAHKDMEKKTL